MYMLWASGAHQDDGESRARVRRHQSRCTCTSFLPCSIAWYRGARHHHAQRMVLPACLPPASPHPKYARTLRHMWPPTSGWQAPGASPRPHGIPIETGNEPGERLDGAAGADVRSSDRAPIRAGGLQDTQQRGACVAHASIMLRCTTPRSHGPCDPHTPHTVPTVPACCPQLPE